MKIFVISCTQGDYSDRMYSILPFAFLKEEDANAYVDTMFKLGKLHEEFSKRMSLEEKKLKLDFDFHNPYPVSPPMNIGNTPPKGTREREIFDDKFRKKEEYKAAIKSIDNMCSATFANFRNAQLTNFLNDIEKDHPEIHTFIKKYNVRVGYYPAFDDLAVVEVEAN